MQSSDFSFCSNRAIARNYTISNPMHPFYSFLFLAFGWHYLKFSIKSSVYTIGKYMYIPMGIWSETSKTLTFLCMK